MVVHKAKVLKIDPVYGEGGVIIEAWVIFKVEGCEIETYHVGIPIAPKIGKEYIIDFRLMTYDLHQINIADKMLKQISTFPMDPIYIVVGEVKEAGEIKSEIYRGKKTKTRIIKVDCGILLDSKVDGWIAEQIQVGDYVAIIGKMFGEILHDNGNGVKG